VVAHAERKWGTKAAVGETLRNTRRHSFFVAGAVLLRRIPTAKKPAADAAAAAGRPIIAIDETNNPELESNEMENRFSERSDRRGRASTSVNRHETE
jgi:hypothetical protein